MGTNKKAKTIVLTTLIIGEPIKHSYLTDHRTEGKNLKKYAKNKSLKIRTICIISTSG